MKPISTILRSFLASGLLASGSAVPAKAQATTDNETVQAEVRLYLWNTVGSALWTEKAKAPAAKEDGTAQREYFVPKGKEYEAVKCVPQSYSEPIHYQGPRKFQLFRKGSGTPDEAAFVPVAETLLPTGGGRYVLFMDGGVKAPRLLVFPYDAGSVAKGQMLLFNAANRGLGVRVGIEKKVLTPNSLAVFSVAAFTDYQMPIEIFDREKEEWVSRVSTRRAIRFDERNLGLLYQRPNDGELAFTLLPTIAWETK
ncbi:hypothetical protein [Luteolibacter sp. LG18]|uniref:hypothetical protein n=1 Tax=Luteolibacter sp. LG18 TaxID=2819286 RepID=UPI002B2F857E|nr:hypothetical protein llg_44230 [Luteolibacter sp. LG18]